MIGGATELHAMVENGQLEQLMTKLSGKPALPDHLAKAVEDAEAQVSKDGAPHALTMYVPTSDGPSPIMVHRRPARPRCCLATSLQSSTQPSKTCRRGCARS